MEHTTQTNEPQEVQHRPRPLTGPCEGCNAADGLRYEHLGGHFCPKCAHRFVVDHGADDNLNELLRSVVVPWWHHWVKAGADPQYLSDALGFQASAIGDSLRQSDELKRKRTEKAEGNQHV